MPEVQKSRLNRTREEYAQEVLDLREKNNKLKQEILSIRSRNIQPQQENVILYTGLSQAKKVLDKLSITKCKCGKKINVNAPLRFVDNALTCYEERED